MEAQVTNVQNQLRQLEAVCDPTFRTCETGQVVQEQLCQVERILEDAQNFFHHGGLRDLTTLVHQESASRGGTFSTVTPQEISDWQDSHQEVKSLVDKLRSDQADLETNIQDLSARADGQSV
ncbi:hypothetical protein ACA910_021821 [Epithemia clementina (nom. ined.)]